MQKTLWLATCVVFVGFSSACTPIPSSFLQNEWVAYGGKDEFTDEVRCDVTYGLSSNDWFSRYGGRIYPLVRFVETDVYAGFTTISLGGSSMPSYEIPIGDVNARIDGNDPVLVTVAETPFGTSSSMSEIAKTNADAFGIDGDSKDKFVKSYESIAKMTSAVALTSGTKAKMLINQMRSGSRLIYRQTANQTGQTARVELAGFEEAYLKCASFVNGSNR